MSMPKGKRIDTGYATISDDDDALNFRQISEIMTKRGHKMNHASARNYLLRAMRKFAIAFADHYGRACDEEQIAEIARSPQFQRVIAELVQNELA